MVKIMKPGAAVTVDYDEMEAEEVFKDITAKLLGINKAGGAVLLKSVSVTLAGKRIGTGICIGML